MRLENIEKANNLKKEIRDIDRFISSASMVWRGKLIIEKRRYIFGSIAYGGVGGQEIEVNTKVKNKILVFLEGYKQELIKEIEEL